MKKQNALKLYFFVSIFLSEKRSLLLSFFILFWTSPIFAQSNKDTIPYLPLIQQIDKLTGYTDVEVDNEGNIFLLNPSSNKICKFFHSTNYDSVYCIGGKGSRSEGFLNLNKISSKNRQALYALDYGKRKIVMFNTNLKVISSMDFLSINSELQPENETELFPISFDVSEWGDLFLLNYADNKVYKYNSTGFSGITFGGVDFGAGNLKEPVNISISDNNQIFVADTAHQSISIYDLYGVFNDVIETRKKGYFHWKSFILFAENLVLFNNKEIALINRATNTIIPIRLQAFEGKFIHDIFMNGNRLYVLSEQSLCIYKIDN